MHTHYILDSITTAKADPAIQSATVSTLWKRCCRNALSLRFTDGAEHTFVIGDTPVPLLKDGKEYAIRVDAHGVAISGDSRGGLLRGLAVLMLKIECLTSAEGSRYFGIPFLSEDSRYRIKNRMLHICVLPEQSLYDIQKEIRLAGLCQYTHIVIEFWGMLQYDCLKPLAWPNAFSKKEVAALLEEARAFGMEPIPMFNQLGHASGSRVCYGKHVVLDQDPGQQELFTPDGWAWDITSPTVFALLREIRRELYALFGEGEYIHIGCDEAYFYTNCVGKRAVLPAYLHRLTAEVAAEGRRPMLWMDMLLERGKYPNCYATCAPEDVQTLTDALHPSSVMVDWQYEVQAAPVPTLLALKDSGFDVMGAPWLNYTAHIDTITQNGLFGMMMTTWDKINSHRHSILGCAKECGAVTYPWSAYSGLFEETATLMRLISFEGNSYADAGWSKVQIEV